MPLDYRLFSADDHVDFRKWCRFQFYDMPPPTQSRVISALRTAMRGPRGTELLTAMGVDLPGVGHGYGQAHQMQSQLAAQPHLLVFRFYTGQPSTLLPARVFRLDLSPQSIVGIHRGEARADARESLTGSRFRTRSMSRDLLGRPAPPGQRLGSSSHAATAHMLRLGPQDLSNMVGSDHRDSSFHDVLTNSSLSSTEQAAWWSTYMHQTGRRHDSLYLSCTAVMPRMVRSGSRVLRMNVMPMAPYLGLFLVPAANMMVRWVHAGDSGQDSVKFSVDEVEVLYKLMPFMESCQILRFRNPFANGTAIPAIGSTGEGPSTLGQCHDPGYAQGNMPGLVHGGTTNLLALD